jgi:hypothetical protein
LNGNVPHDPSQLTEVQDTMTTGKPKRALAMALMAAFVNLGLGLGFAFAASQEPTATPADKSVPKSRNKILQRLSETPLSPNRVQNEDRAPLLILSGGSKEISNVEYRWLVGRNTPSKSLVSFPEVTLQNVSGNEIKAFAMLLRNRQTGAMHFFKTSGISLMPLDEYQVVSERWVRPEKLSSRADTADGKPTLSTLLKDPSQRAMFWVSERMWLVGNASDIELRIGLVEFVDGSRWTSPSDAEPTRESKKVVSAAAAGYSEPER